MDPNQQPVQPPVAPPNYQPAPPMPGAAPGMTPGEDPGKTLAIVGIVLAFVFTLAGLIVSIVANNKSKAAGFKNQLATVGIILNATLMVIGLIVGIIFGIIAFSAAGSLQKMAADNNSIVNGKKDFSKGEVGKFGNLEVTVNSVKRDYVSSSQYNLPDDGKEFVLINVTVKNSGTKSEYFGPSTLELNDSGIANTSTFVDGVTDIDGGDLSPGTSVTGDMPFEVTKGSSDLKLQYQTYVISTQGTSVSGKDITYTLEI